MVALLSALTLAAVSQDDGMKGAIEMPVLTSSTLSQMFVPDTTPTGSNVSNSKDEVLRSVARVAVHGEEVDGFVVSSIHEVPWFGEVSLINLPSYLWNSTVFPLSGTKTVRATIDPEIAAKCTSSFCDIFVFQFHGPDSGGLPVTLIEDGWCHGTRWVAPQFIKGGMPYAMSAWQKQLADGETVRIDLDSDADYTVIAIKDGAGSQWCAPEDWAVPTPKKNVVGAAEVSLHGEDVEGTPISSVHEMEWFDGIDLVNFPVCLWNATLYRLGDSTVVTAADDNAPAEISIECVSRGCDVFLFQYIGQKHGGLTHLVEDGWSVGAKCQKSRGGAPQFVMDGMPYGMVAFQRQLSDGDVIDIDLSSDMAYTVVAVRQSV